MISFKLKTIFLNQLIEFEITSELWTDGPTCRSKSSKYAPLLIFDHNNTGSFINDGTQQAKVKIR